ncbi:MAG: GNAT family N-acetyltransferase [Shinella sp.]|nr:GNAT family N-acetyltransferase [Shinella sp.]
MSAGTAKSDLDLLAIDIASTFRLSRSGRILRENDPERSTGPLVFFAGCAQGNLVHVHDRVPEEAAVQVFELLGREPPWLDPGSEPAALARVLKVLEGYFPAMPVRPSVIYHLTRQPAAPDDLRFVCSGTAAGNILLESLDEAGLREHLADAGFAGPADFWAPWCAVLEGRTIISIAFSARLGEHGAEVGVYTFSQWRSMGLAAAATAKWTSHPDLAGRELFYSASTENASSQRVAARLGLRRFAAGLRIG